MMSKYKINFRFLHFLITKRAFDCLQASRENQDQGTKTAYFRSRMCTWFALENYVGGGYMTSLKTSA